MPVQDKYQIYVYDPTGVLLYVLSQVRSARYRLGECEVGDFEITIPWGDGKVPGHLSPPNQVEFYRGTTPVFGGVIRRQSAAQSGKTLFYTVSGPSYMQWLADAKVTSVTGTGDVTFASDNLDDTIKLAVTNYVIPNNSKFVVAAASGLSAKVEAYTATGYENVLEVIQAIAKRAEDTTFDIIRDTDKQLRFRTWTPSRGPDRSKGTSSPVLFDLRGGNITDAEWVRDGNKVVNALRGGGPGTKAARYIYPAVGYLTNSQSILDWGRIEGFFDAGSETTANTDKKTIEELDKQSVPEESVSFKVAPAGRYVLGEDFDFGTKVTVVWPPLLEFTDTIRGIEVTLSEATGLAQVDINVGDTITGSENTRASIEFGRFLRSMRRSISVQTRH
jgi:hypothetical protein